MADIEQIHEQVVDFAKMYGGVYYLSSYADSPPSQWNDLVTYNATDLAYYTPMWTQGTDMVGKSNQMAFMQEFGHLPVVSELPDGIAISLNLDDWYMIEEDDEHAAESLLNALGALSDYPLLDEHIYSELFAEEESKAWENWVEYEYRQELEKRYHIDLSECAGEDLFQIFFGIMDATSTYFEPEGDSVYINMEAIVTATPLEQLQQALRECLLVCRLCRGLMTEEACDEAHGHINYATHRNDRTIRNLERQAATGDPFAKAQLAIVRGDQMVPLLALDLL